MNALVAAETMTGADGFTVHALPYEPLRRILERHDRLASTPARNAVHHGPGRLSRVEVPVVP